MGNFPALFVLLAIALLSILFGREIFCWYWKINRRMALLEEGVQLLRQLRDAANRAEQEALEARAADLRRGPH